jgi:hypothetical protein
MILITSEEVSLPLSHSSFFINTCLPSTNSLFLPSLYSTLLSPPSSLPFTGYIYSDGLTAADKIALTLGSSSLLAMALLMFTDWFHGTVRADTSTDPNEPQGPKDREWD